MSVKTAGVGHFQIPTAPAAGVSCTSGAANVYTTTYVQLIASTAAALYITGIYVEEAAATAGTYISVQLATGAAASETIIGQYLIAPVTGSTVARAYRPIFPPIPVANATRIACKTADSVGAQAKLITLECIAQSNVVDDGIAVGTVTTVTNQLTAAAIATGVWQDATAGDFTAANSVGKSVMNGVALGTGLTINALTNLPAITANWLTAAGITAGALNGKGDWNIGKTGYALSAAGVQAIWDALTSALTTVSSIGKLIVDNLNATISSRAPSATALSNVDYTAGRAAKLDNLDVVVSTRLASAGYTAPLSAAATANAVWDELTATHAGVGSTGLALTTAAALGAPLTAAGTRAALGLAAANLDTQLGAIQTSATDIKAKTDSLTFSSPGKLDVRVLIINGVTLAGSGTAADPMRPA